VVADDPAFLLTDARKRTTDEASQALSRYLSRVLIKRRKAPGDDLLSHLLAVMDQQRFLNFEELVINLVFLITAGIKTTSDFLGNTLAAVRLFPNQAKLFLDPQQPVSKLLEECLRYDSPIQQTPRFTAEAVTLGGIEIPAGEHLMLMVGAANRDPIVFENPHDLQLLRRNADKHIAFGGGAHHCLGSVFARAEAEIALPALLQRFPNICPTTGAVRMAGFTLRGFDHLPVQLCDGVCSG